MSDSELSAGEKAAVALMRWISGLTLDGVTPSLEEFVSTIAQRFDAFAEARIAAAVAAERARLAGIARAKHHSHYELGEAYLKEENYDMAHSHRTLATCYSKVLDWLEEEGAP